MISLINKIKLNQLLLAVALITSTASTAVAQQANGNANTYGMWEVTSDEGFSGTLLLSRGSCQLSLQTAVLSVNQFCQTSWNAQLNTLTIVGSSAINSHTVPSYSNNGPIAYSSGGGAGLVTLSITRFGRSFMSGHIIGVGDHVGIKLARH